jgi:Kef-type K+ transport system membrane component KefB
MSFGALALVMAAGLLGPSLAGASRYRVPVVVGELAAGLVIGVSGFGWVDPDEPALAFLGEVGFAVLMLIAGTHLPLRMPGLRHAAKAGTVATVLTFALAVPVAYGLSHVTSLHDTGILVLLLATSSAAVVMPVLTEGRTSPSRTALIAVAWVGIADIVSVVLVPVVLAQGDVGRVVLGSLLVVAGSGVVLVGVQSAAARDFLNGPARESVLRGWALRLRFWLVILFALAWLATEFGASVLIAGFSLGAVISVIGEPRSVARELIGVGEGFVVPVFFVLLGARLDVGALFTHPGDFGLIATLAVGTVALHLAVARVTRVGWPTGLLASAQLGVPAAIASVGLDSGVLDPGQAAAIVAAAALMVGGAAVGAARLRHPVPPASAAAGA